ncbi:MAG: CinA family nicotinamide mononucleotide deamidase-related protein [Chloroflexi bacterium]|nr:CinA family nicotinamide mononucleotide deamidase-related protein [Chloroflexota bacterium]
MKAEIISVGTELLQGEITDTDSAFLASQLPLLGIELQWISAVGDDLGKMEEVFKRAWQRSDIILITGGLGPTADDLTREAIAALLGEKMEVVPSLEKTLREFFIRIRVEMSPSNLKQATLIPSAQAIPNSQGTAPGWWVEKDGRTLIAMPGPPRELEEIWRRDIEPRLRTKSRTVILSKTFKTSGLTEPGVGDLVTPLFAMANPLLGVYAKPDGIHLRLIAKAETREQAQAMIAESEAYIRKQLDKYIWGTNDDTLESIVGNLLLERGLSLAAMEDYSGGWLAGGISDIPGCTSFFKGGLVACSDEAKIALGIDAELIHKYGAISAEVAQAMAEVARSSFKAAVGIGITGADGTNTALSGTAYVAIAWGKNSVTTSRFRGKRRATTAAMIELRKLLLEAGQA